MTGQLMAGESYNDLLLSGPHWLFELTLELLSAPLAFAVGWLWRNGLLRHLHRDLHALAHDVPRECVEAMSSGRLAHRPTTRTPQSSREVTPGAPDSSIAGATQRDIQALAAQIEVLREELRAAQDFAASDATKESHEP